MALPLRSGQALRQSSRQVRTRALYPVLAGWEILRLLGLLGLFAYAAYGTLFPRGETLVLALLLGAGNLLVPAGALYLYFTKTVSRPLRLILVAAKVIGLFTAVLALAAVFLGFTRAGAADSPSAKYFFEGFALLAIFLLDLIFLNLLLSFKEEADTTVVSPPSG